MSYEKRYDGRKFDEMRPVKMELGVLTKADGSAMVEIGKTKIVAGVYGPSNVTPRHLEKKKQVLLRCYYDLISFSVTDRARPGPSRRSRELGLVMKNALLPSIISEEYPKSMIEVFVEVVQADAGTRCAAICAASLALADAGFLMKDLVGSVAAGTVGDKVVLDLTKKEEDYEDGVTDIPIAYLPSEEKITLLQLDGEVSSKKLIEAIEMGIKGCKELHEMQKKTIKEKYKQESL